MIIWTCYSCYPVILLANGASKGLVNLILKYGYILVVFQILVRFVNTYNICEGSHNTTHVKVHFLYLLYQKNCFNRKIRFSDRSFFWTKRYRDVFYWRDLGKRMWYLNA